MHRARGSLDLALSQSPGPCAFGSMGADGAMCDHRPAHVRGRVARPARVCHRRAGQLAGAFSG